MSDQILFQFVFVIQSCCTWKDLSLVLYEIRIVFKIERTFLSERKIILNDGTIEKSQCIQSFQSDKIK